MDGWKDCRIYEAVLDIASHDKPNVRPKFLVTKDAHFNVPELVAELSTHGFSIRDNPGQLYGELK